LSAVNELGDTHDEALVRAFIDPAKREQYLSRLASPKTRQKFISKHFPHMRDLDQRYAHRLEPRDAHAETIYAELHRRGAPDHCYVLSSSSSLDGQEVPLYDALDDVVGSSDGTFVSCIPGKLAYFEGEEPNERYILERSG
jgi:hypothetical protein